MNNGIQILVERKKQRVRQRDLAEALGVAEAVIIAIENGRWGTTDDDRDRALESIRKLASAELAVGADNL